MKIHNYNHEAFTIENELSYYLLGVFITDGCVYKSKSKNSYQFELSSKDKDWLKDIAAIISDTMVASKAGKKRNDYRIRGTCSQISDWLMSKNCTPRKSLTVKMPNIPEQYFFDFLRGVVDGDGSINFNSKNYTYAISISSASQKFLKSIRKTLSTYSINSGLRTAKKRGKIETIRGRQFITKNNVYSLTITSRYAYKLCKFMYKNSTLGLERKKLKALDIIKHFESKGLSLDNFDTHECRSGNNSPQMKIPDQEILKILKKWFAISQSIRDGWGFKTKFYSDEIKNKYFCTYELFSQIIRGKVRKDLYNTFIKNLN